jgi:O-antigen ligase
VITTTMDDRSGPIARAGAASGGWRALCTPVGLIQIYVVVLVLIPPTLIIEPLGAAGTPASVVGLVALLFWGVSVVLPEMGLPRTVVPVRVVMGLLVGVVLVRYAALHIGYIPVDELLASDRLVLTVFSWAGVALLAAEGLQNRAEINRVVRTLVVVVAVMALIGLLQFRAGIDLSTWVRRIPGLHENADLDAIQSRSGFRRPAGTAAHPIEFGCVIAMTLPLALHVARFGAVWTRARRWLPLAVIAIGIPVAVSRSAIVGAAVAGLVIFLGLDPRVRPKALVAVAGFVTLIYATTPGLLGTLRGFFLSTGSDSRINDYARSIEIIRQQPWFGHGPGTFIADSRLGGAFDNILDNQYLMTLIELGLVGLAVVLAYLLATAFLARGARHRSTDPATRDLGQALAAASVAAAVTAYTFDAFSFRMFSGFIPACLGVAGALWATTRAGEPSGEQQGSAARTWPRPERIATPVIGLVAVPADYGAGDEGEAVAERTARVDLAPAITLDDLGDAASALNDPTAEEPVCLEAPPPEAGPVGTHDLRRAGVLIGAGAAIIVLVGLPFLVDESDGGGGQVDQMGVVTAPGMMPSDLSATTVKADEARTQPSAGQSRAVDTTAPGTGTTVPGGSADPTATTAPPTATTATTATTVSTTTTTDETTTTSTASTTTTETP